MSQEAPGCLTNFHLNLYNQFLQVFRYDMGQHNVVEVQGPSCNFTGACPREILLLLLTPLTVTCIHWIDVT